MVKGRLDEVFGALSDPTRRAMVADLARLGSQTVGELAAPHAMSLPAISKHLAILERSGLVSRRRQGRSLVCTLNPVALRPASEWIDLHERFWQERIDSLQHFLGEEA